MASFHRIHFHRMPDNRKQVHRTALHLKTIQFLYLIEIDTKIKLKFDEMVFDELVFDEMCSDEMTLRRICS